MAAAMEGLSSSRPAVYTASASIALPRIHEASLPPSPTRPETVPELNRTMDRKLSALQNIVQKERERQREERIAQTPSMQELHDVARSRVNEARMRARQYTATRQWEECEEALSDALEYDSRNAALYSYRSMVLLNLKMPRRALADAERSIKIEPLSPRGYYRQGRVFYTKEEYTQAGSSLIKTLALDPTDTRAEHHFDAVLSTIQRNRPYWTAPNNARLRVLASTPPPSCTAPGACRMPRATMVEDQRMRLVWDVVDDDGGDEPFQYELQGSIVNPLMLDAPYQWVTYYSGLGEMSVIASGLHPDMEYVWRVRATNAIGAGVWSSILTQATLPFSGQKRVLLTDIPRAWHDLQPNMTDLFKVYQNGTGVQPALQWAQLVNSLQQHMPALKLAFKMYSLMNKKDDSEDEMDLHQWRCFVSDAQVKLPVPPDVDIIFIRANREVDDLSGGTEKLEISGDDNPDGKMIQHEFVGGVVRLAHAKCGGALAGKSADSHTSLASALDELMERYLVPNTTFELQDELSASMSTRGVRAALLKSHDALDHIFCYFAKAEASDRAGKSQMSLNEMLMMLHESDMFDGELTVREATAFFVMVNMDDEIYVAEEESDSAAELCFDEFLEVVARICHKKVPREREGPFEITLDSWLCLYFVPRVLTAIKRLKNASLRSGVTARGASRQSSRGGSRSGR